MDNQVTVEISARHVHLSQADLETLFGKGYELTVKKMLSQPGQYASNERVRVVGTKSEFPAVSILGPCVRRLVRRRRPADRRAEAHASRPRAAHVARAPTARGNAVQSRRAVAAVDPRRVPPGRQRVERQRVAAARDRALAAGGSRRALIGRTDDRRHCGSSTHVGDRVSAPVRAERRCIARRRPRFRRTRSGLDADQPRWRSPDTT